MDGLINKTRFPERLVTFQEREILRNKTKKKKIIVEKVNDKAATAPKKMLEYGWL